MAKMKRTDGIIRWSMDEVRRCYKYYLIQGKVRIENEKGYHVMDSYGIEVIREDYSGSKKVLTEREVILNVSPNKEKVYALLCKMAEGLLSPVHLVEYFDEIADDYYRDFDMIFEEVKIAI